MADLITTIKVNSSQFDNSIKESTNQIRKFEAEAKKTGGSVGDFGGKLGGVGMGALTKFAGAAGIAFTAVETFEKIISATQGTSDLFANTIGATKDTVDQFFKSISSGDFSNFTNGLGDVWERAKKAREELDQLWNTINSVSLAQAAANSKIKEGRRDATDPDATYGQKLEGLKKWEEGVNDYKESTKTLIEDTESTVRSIVGTYNTLDTQQITIPIITETILIDSKGKKTRDALKDKYNSEYKEYSAKSKEVNKSYTKEMAKVNPNDFEKITKIKQQQLKQQEALNNKYQKSIIANSLLNQMTDDQLEDTTNKLKSIHHSQEQISDNDYTLNKGKQRVENSIGKDNKPNKPNKPNKAEKILPEGSIAFIEDKLKDLRAELKLVITDEDRLKIQEEIKEWEGKLEAIDLVLNPVVPEEVVVPVKPIRSSRNPLFDYKKSEYNKLSEELAIEENYLRELQKDAEHFADEILVAVENVEKLNSALDLEELKNDLKAAKEELKRSFIDGWNSLGNVVGYFDSLGKSIKALKDPESSDWEKFVIIFDMLSSTVNTAVGVIDTINNISSAIDTLSSIESIFDPAVEIASITTISAAKIAANTAEATSAVASNAAITASLTPLIAAASTLMAAQSTAAYASMPFVGVGLAAAQIATMKGLITASAIPFADGGLVYSTTFAKVGEYAGASSNPEVIAPLNKLRKILQDDNNTGTSSVDFRIAGKDLVGVLSNYQSKNNRK